MSAGFTFPPPPPPPPPAGRQPNDNHDSGRGRGQSFGARRGARGGRQSDGHARGNAQSLTAAPPGIASSTISYNRPQMTRSVTNSSNHYHSQPHKRQRLDHESDGSWRGGQASTQYNRPHPMQSSSRLPKTVVSPAVPGFGSSTVQLSSPTNNNILGLTPSNLEPPLKDDTSDSEADKDIDEEEAFRSTKGDV